ncbi:MAG: Fur family transcriptional regulator [Firmicutes bacterium]|nr:Fur family transcriptional regulator [Bacillota bacterium]
MYNSDTATLPSVASFVFHFKKAKFWGDNMDDELKQALHEKGLRLTPQRQIILEVMLNLGGRHLTADEIYSLVKKQTSDVSLATIYRTLELFVDMNIFRRFDSGDGVFRYEIDTKKSEHYHHHLICLNCGKIKEFNDDLLDELENRISEKGFVIADHCLRFFGYCKECKNALENEKDS